MGQDLRYTRPHGSVVLLFRCLDHLFLLYCCFRADPHGGYYLYMGWYYMRPESWSPFSDPEKQSVMGVRCGQKKYVPQDTIWHHSASLLTFEPHHDKMACAPSEDSDQPGHQPSLISLRCALNGYLRTHAFFMRAAKTLIRLGGFPGWSESSLGVQSLCWFCHVAAHFLLMILESSCLQMSLDTKKTCLRSFQPG